MVGHNRNGIVCVRSYSFEAALDLALARLGLDLELASFDWNTLALTGSLALHLEVNVATILLLDRGLLFHLLTDEAEDGSVGQLL